MKNRNISKFADLFNGIYQYNVLRHFKTLSPTEMQINVTYKCNSKCQMCRIWEMKPKNELSLAEWKRILKDPIFLTVNRLSIAGGEPMLCKDLVSLVGLYLDSMPKLKFLSLVTNGFLTELTVLRVQDLSKLCDSRGIRFSVTVSLDGIGETHEKIRHIPNAFEKTAKTILTLKDLQKEVNFNLKAACVICASNIYEVEKVEKWCFEKGISFNYQLVGFHKTYVQNLDSQNDLDFQLKDKKFLYNMLERLAVPKSFKDLRSYYWNDMLHLYKENGTRTTPCPFVLDAFVLDSLGDVYYCLSEEKIGNCRSSSTVSQIYYDPDNLAFRKKLTQTACLECNSACMVSSALAKDFKKAVWFLLSSCLQIR